MYTAILSTICYHNRRHRCVWSHTMSVLPYVMAMMAPGSLSACRHFFHMATAECTYRLQRAGRRTQHHMLYRASLKVDDTKLPSHKNSIL